MKILKEIFNSPENVTEYHNMLFMIYLVFGLFVSILGFATIEYWAIYIIPLVFTVYFYVINTNDGKKKFTKINNFMSYICFIGLFFSLLSFIGNVFHIRSLIDLLSLLINLTYGAFYFYWIMVFVSKKENKLTDQNNRNFFNIIISCFIGLYFLYYITLVFYYKDAFSFSLLISNIIGGLLYILRLRYIYLYQKYLLTQEDVMFAQIEKEDEIKIEVEEVNYPKEKIESKGIFLLDNISNENIGSRIKDFAKVFFKIQLYFLIVLSFFIFFVVCTTMKYIDPATMLFLIILIMIILFSFFLAYYGFLIITGFGALVEDVNKIKKKSGRKPPKNHDKLSN